ncbi:MAG TPA: MerC domain-containing protein [Polyangiales bacterium]
MHFAIDLQTDGDNRMLSRMSPRPVESTPAQAAASPVERAASWLSLLCAVHCLVMPLLLGALPLLGASSSLQIDGALDHALNALVIVSALAGAAWGYRRHHDGRFVMSTMLGLAAYLMGHAWEAHWYGILAAVAGALVLAGSSFLGARLGHQAVHTHADASCSH